MACKKCGGSLQTIKKSPKALEKAWRRAKKKGNRYFYSQVPRCSKCKTYYYHAPDAVRVYLAPSNREERRQQAEPVEESPGWLTSKRNPDRYYRRFFCLICEEDLHNCVVMQSRNGEWIWISRSDGWQTGYETYEDAMAAADDQEGQFVHRGCIEAKE